MPSSPLLSPPARRPAGARRFWTARVAAWMALAALAGPARAAADPPARATRPKIGLVLSGGGARGGAHIGVLKILEREHIPIDCIAGTSFGALVGSFYALGYSAQEIESIFVGQDWNELFSDAPDRRLAPLQQRRALRYQAQVMFHELTPELPTGLWSGQKLIQIFDRYTTDRMMAAGYDFDRLAIPFRTVATDLVTGKPYVFRKGRMTEALRASVAIPMIFTPVAKDDMLLVDGGLIDNLPADLAREMGAEVIIAVDVSSPLLDKAGIRTLLDVMDQTLGLMMRQSMEGNARLVDLMIRPDLDGFTTSSYAQIREIVPRGERAAEARLADLRARVGARAGLPAPPPAPARPATIESISFVGLHRVRPRQLRQEIKSRPKEPLDLEKLGGDLSRLHATQMFDQIDYDLLPVARDRYHLTYTMKESALNRLGASIRYDRDYTFVALTEFTTRELLNPFTSATISSQFGGLENHSASMRIHDPHLPGLFLEPGVHVRRRERLDVRGTDIADTFTDKRLGGELMLGSSFRGLEVLGGFHDERVRIDGGTAPNQASGTQRLAGLEFQLRRDALDHQEIPQSGSALSLRFRKLGTKLGGDFDFSTWEGDFQRYFQISPVSTVRIRASSAFSRGELPFFERFYVGGYSFSEGAARQLVGFDRDTFAARQAAIAGASYTRQIFSRPLSFARRGFASLHYNVAGISARQEPTYRFNFSNGAGAELVLDTILGPLRVAGGWGEQGRFKFYLSFGPSF